MSGHIHHPQPPQADGSSISKLIAALNGPQAFGHPVQYIRHIETHISWVILTGEFAYKIKKPVKFGFLDFSTLAKRRYCCEQELRLNQRFAPGIYLDLKPIGGSHDRPTLSGKGSVIEYAIQMREFPQDCLLSSYCSEGRLTTALIDQIADRISQLHRSSARAEANTDYGSPSLVKRWSKENIQQIERVIPQDRLPRDYGALQHWYSTTVDLDQQMEQRRQQGFVRDCHGDLHLGNMALIDDQITLFDCIEFNPELRWIDTISEAAFVAMDLQARGHHEFCWQFLNRYLESSNDYSGLELLAYYVIYRALVRAKVAALRAEQENSFDLASSAPSRLALDYIGLAAQWASYHTPALIIMHGLSGSGKSTIAGQIAQACGAIQLRSDNIRKKLFGLEADQDSGSATGKGIYSPTATADTYAQLAQTAAVVIKAGFTVIADATFLDKQHQQLMLELAKSCDCPALIVHCEAPETELRQRIVERQTGPSEANLEVLQRQIDFYQPLEQGLDSSVSIVTIDSHGLDPFRLQQIRDLIGS